MEKLLYWVSNDYGNFAKPKKLAHPRGQKFYFVAWDESSCGREYWLTYTRNEREDEILLAGGRNWVKIPQGAAIELVKRGWQIRPAISDFVRQGGQYTHLSEPPFWFVSRVIDWLSYQYRPILPYVVDIDSAEIFAGKVWINKKSYTVEEV